MTAAARQVLPILGAQAPGGAISEADLTPGAAVQWPIGQLALQADVTWAAAVANNTVPDLIFIISKGYRP